MGDPLPPPGLSFPLNKERAVLGDSCWPLQSQRSARSVGLGKSSRTHVAGGVGRRVSTALREEKRKALEDGDSFGCGEKGRGGVGKEETQEEEGPRGGGGDRPSPEL